MQESQNSSNPWPLTLKINILLFKTLHLDMQESMGQSKKTNLYHPLSKSKFHPQTKDVSSKRISFLLFSTTKSHSTTNITSQPMTLMCIHPIFYHITSQLLIPKEKNTLTFEQAFPLRTGPWENRSPSEKWRKINSLKFNKTLKKFKREGWLTTKPISFTFLFFFFLLLLLPLSLPLSLLSPSWSLSLFFFGKWTALALSPFYRLS